MVIFYVKHGYVILYELFESSYSDLDVYLDELDLGFHGYALF